tara:strand:+ start:507 stop:1274 length:768 start_codon:yes stop_codon:yes gene_type:complete
VQWCVCVGKAGNDLNRNLEKALAHSTWGTAREDYYNEWINGLAIGDKVIFLRNLVLIKVGSKGPRRLLTEFWGRGELVTVKITTPPYKSREKIWNDEEYPYRFDFEIESYNEIDLEDLPYQIRDAFRKSIIHNARLYNSVSWEKNPKDYPQPFGADEKLSKSYDKKGYVYVLENPAWNNWFKVGCSINIEQREDSYQTYSPFRDSKMIYWKESEKCYSSEQKVHQELRKSIDFSSKNEWHSGKLGEIKKIISKHC